MIEVLAIFGFGGLLIITILGCYWFFREEEPLPKALSSNVVVEETEHLVASKTIEVEGLFDAREEEITLAGQSDSPAKDLAALGRARERR